MAFIEKVRWYVRSDTVMRNVNKIFTAVFCESNGFTTQIASHTYVFSFSRVPVDTLSLDPQFNITQLNTKY